MTINLRPTLTKKAMKKSLLIIAMFIGATATAQDLTSKKGTPILPEAGEWSIGVGASSTLEYFGNLMNGNNNAPAFDWANDQIITGKMMKDANTAYRAYVRLGLGSNKAEGQEVDLGGGTFVDSIEVKTSSTNIALGAGLQKYRGKGRLRGIYGAEAMIMLSGGKETWEGSDDLVGAISLEDKSGSTFGLGIRAFIGAEYFFAPKMSLGGEFGWGLSLTSTGEGEISGSIDGDAIDPIKTGKSSSFGIDTDNFGGSIILNLYF